MNDLITDVHTHPILPAYKDILTGDASADSSAGVTLPRWDLDADLENMDDHAIGVSVLSMPGLNNVNKGDDAATVARGLNEELAATVARCPERLGAFAVVPMNDMAAALSETAYAFDALKLDGVCVGTNFAGTYLGGDYFDPWLAELDERGATVFVHPDEPPGFSVEDATMNVAVLEFMFETTRMAATMVLSGAEQRFQRQRHRCPRWRHSSVSGHAYFADGRHAVGIFRWPTACVRRHHCRIGFVLLRSHCGDIDRFAGRDACPGGAEPAPDGLRLSADAAADHRAGEEFPRCLPPFQ